MNIKYAAIAAIILLAGCQTTKDAPNLVALGVDFTWHGTQACSSVPPAFEIANIPEGTATLEFRMTDLDVPSFNHGGGSVKYTGSGSIPAGSFSYEFVVSAVNAAGDTVLGRGSATKSFPPK